MSVGMLIELTARASAAGWTYRRRGIGDHLWLDPGDPSRYLTLERPAAGGPWVVQAGNRCYDVVLRATTDDGVAAVLAALEGLGLAPSVYLAGAT